MNPHRRKSLITAKRKGLYLSMKRKERERMKDVKEKLKEENDFMRYLITQVLNALPAKRDWLDPDIEMGMKSMCNPMMVRISK